MKRLKEGEEIIFIRLKVIPSTLNFFFHVFLDSMVRKNIKDCVLFSWASRLRFWTFDNTVLEVYLLDISEENNKSEPVSHREDLVRIILLWYRQPGSNLHTKEGESKGDVTLVKAFLQAFAIMNMF